LLTPNRFINKLLGVYFLIEVQYRVQFRKYGKKGCITRYTLNYTIFNFFFF